MIDLPRGWAKARLEELAEEVTGSIVPDPSTQYELYSVPAFPARTPEVVGGAVIGSNKRQVSPDDVLLCKINPRINRVWFVGPFKGRPQLASTEFIPLRLPPGNETIAQYLMWYLRSPRFRDWIKLNAEGATGSHSRAKSPGILRQFIPVAPLREGTRIVAVIEEQFSRLDAGVAALENVARNIKRLRAAVLEAAVTGLLLDDARVTEKRKPSAFGVPTGELPANWRWAELGDYIVEGPQNGLYLPASQYGRGTAILRIADFQDGWAQRRDALQLVAASADDAITFALEVGDIVINRVNSMTHLGKCLVVTPSLAGAVFESNMMRLRTSDELTGEYLALYLQSNRGRSQLLTNAKQAVNQASINQNDVRRCRIAVPPRHEQKAIISIHETVSANLASIAALVRLTRDRASSLRSAILAAAFSGELVLQDPKDEPASVLLERVASERASNRHKTAGGRKSGPRPNKVLA